LQACPACEALLDITAHEPLEMITCKHCGAPFQVNGHIGHFRIEDVAGRGGMGVVYKAYDPSLDRHIALKLLRKDRSDDSSYLEQLELEAAITATVADPNVVRVYATGTDRDRFYIVMELVEKGSLQDLMDLQGKIAEGQVLQIGIQAAKGLRAAHKAGLIHRDVKPGNILFSDANTSKIVDFGLAVFQRDEEKVRGIIWGTPHYVAPEKLDFKPEDFRSDIYSLGGTLFHALAGRPPFDADEMSLIVLKHLKSQPVSLQAFAPWVSNATARIINRMLAKEPSQRFESYDELIESLEYAYDQLIHTDPKTPVRTRVVMESAEDERRWSGVVIAFIVATLAALVGGYLMLRPKPVVQRDILAERLAPPAGMPRDLLGALATQKVRAPQAFHAIAINEKLAPVDRAWAQLLEGTAWLSQNKSAETKEAFAAVPALAKQMKDQNAGAFLVRLSTRLNDPAQVSSNEAANLDDHNYEAAALLLYGLHTWQHGQPEAGRDWLKKFMAASPEGSTAWLEQLKPLANAFVQKLARFDSLRNQYFNATDPGRRADLAAQLRAVDPILAPRADKLLTTASTPAPAATPASKPAPTPAFRTAPPATPAPAAPAAVSTPP
jgi:hypothetical protein